ncbi:hypothetical protein Vretimale_4923 [Volvox reticuliferus]|uniref:Uncharacterized protein n=1 Tax=Volvox reticuliferus TaxID=1737510 RepID=A0A8J4G4M8_9CHLO|nr:hypothetical protein Vretimale_4923 [Volvox reticuliferus]
MGGIASTPAHALAIIASTQRRQRQTPHRESHRHNRFSIPSFFNSRRLSLNSKGASTPTAAAPPPPSPSIQTVPGDPSRVWLPELVLRIAGFLPQNEVAATLRLVSKSAADQLRGPPYTTIRAWEPVPHHYFARCWGPTRVSSRDPPPGSAAAADGAGGGDGNLEIDVQCSENVRCLTWLQRMTLLVRTAASGSIENMQGVPWSHNTICPAVRRGDVRLVKWAVGNGAPWGVGTLCVAAAAGHVELCLWFLEHIVSNPLPVLDWLWSDVIAYAAASPTPDWRRKVEWLEEGGHDRTPRASEMVSERVLEVTKRHHAEGGSGGGNGSGGDENDVTQARPSGANGGGGSGGGGGGGGGGAAAAEPSSSSIDDSSCVARLTWLQRRGYPMTVGAVRSAARAGNVAALQYLLGPGGVRLNEQSDNDLVNLACVVARGGHLKVLKVLQSHGVPITRGRVLGMAVLGGRLPVVKWLVDQIIGQGVSTAGGGAGGDNVAAVVPGDAGGGAGGDNVAAVVPGDAGGGAGGDNVAAVVPGDAGGAGGGVPAAPAAVLPLPQEPGGLDPVLDLLPLNNSVPDSAVRRRPQMCPALTATFTEGGFSVPEMVRSLAVFAIMSGYPLGIPWLQPTWPAGGTDAQVNRLELLTWLYDQGLAELHPGVFKMAAQYGDLRMMTWLYERGCPWDAHTFAAAAYAGGEMQLEWLAARGCPMGVSVGVGVSGSRSYENWGR